MNVLLAIDSSSTAHAALAATLARTWPERTQFKVFTVLSKPSNNEEFSKRTEKALRLLERATDLIETQNPDSVVIGHLETGDAASSILAAAESWSADLVIVGSDDRGPFERLVMGSVAQKVLENARSSVLVARNFDCFLNRVLIAIDGSESSKTVVSEVMQTVWPADTQFHLLSVMPPPGISMFETDAFRLSDQLDAHAISNQQATVVLEDAVAQITEVQGRSCASYSIADGQTPHAILATARVWQPDLIIIGSRRLTGWKGRLLGSVSKSIATHADCSVQVLRSNVLELKLPQFVTHQTAERRVSNL